MSSATPNGHSTLRVYRDASSLEELREFWSSRQTEPAGNLDFFLTVVCASPVFVRPHVIVLFEDNQPQSLLLGRLERRSIEVRLGYLRLPTPKLDILTFDDCGWLRGVSAADSELLVRNILASLRGGEADAAALQHLDTAHPLCELARSLPSRLFSDHVPLIQVHWVRRLDHMGSFLGSLPKKRRYQQRRRAKVLHEDFGGEVTIDCFHDGTRIKQLMLDAEAVAKTSYQRGLGVGFVNDERMHGRLSLAAQQGTLRAYVLYLGNRPCAFWITSLWAKILYSEFMGFDPAYARYEPGTYLAIKVIEEVSNGAGGPSATIVDLGLGEAQYKAVLGNDRRRVASLYIFSPTGKGLAMNMLRITAILADRAAKAILERTGILAELKQRWRRLVTQHAGSL